MFGGAGRPKGSRNRKGAAVKGLCVGYGREECGSRAGCKYSSGPKRSFCRKSSSRRRAHSNRSSLNSILNSKSGSVHGPTRRRRRH